MSNSLVQFRVDENERAEATTILNQLGLDLPSYFRICMARLIKERGIPFSMKIDDTDNKGIQALKRASKIAEKYSISDMSLDEINAEITASRK